MDKKLRISIICSIIIIVMAFGSIALSDSLDAYNKYIKVGLESPLYSDKCVNLYSSEGFTLMTLKEGFKKIIDIPSDALFVRLDHGFDDLLIETGPYHIQLDKSYSSYEEVILQVAILRTNNISAYPYYDGDIYKIWIGQFSSEEAALDYIGQIQGTIVDQMEVVHPDGRKIFINEFSGQELLAFDKDAGIYIGSTKDVPLTSIVKVENRKYRGYITFNRVGSELKVINYISMEQYLYGVVPREMSGSWPMEALKAQAVAARNYGLQRLNTHGHEGYDLCDTTHCQVYGGYDSENINSTRAVIETTGKVLTYNGQIVSTYYHSSSGGKTENSENVWSGVIPYLRGVNDEFSIGAPNQNWKLVMSESQVKQILEGNGISIGDIVSIQPVEYSDSGRVINLAIVGTEGFHFLQNEKSRAIFGYNSLKSTMYEVESQGGAYVMGANSTSPKRMSLEQATVLSATGIQTPTRSSGRDDNEILKVYNGDQVKTITSTSISYVFEGSGWGHGLGMSQWGAKRMAEEGYSYEEILQHYYTGSKVE